jgi:hypothetical protein
MLCPFESMLNLYDLGAVSDPPRVFEVRVDPLLATKTLLSDLSPLSREDITPRRSPQLVCQRLATSH